MFLFDGMGMELARLTLISCVGDWLSASTSAVLGIGLVFHWDVLGGVGLVFD